MRLRLIACEVIAREVYHLAARAPGVVDVHLITQGLHDVGATPMREKLQAEIDRTDPKLYDAVALGYALCSNGTVGLRARDVPLAIPRAHDCITLLLGSRARYDREFAACPGTYYLSSGWHERDDENAPAGPGGPRDLGMSRRLEEYVSLYGEDNARYIMEQLEGGLRHYERILFVESGLGDEGPARRAARARAEREGWRLDVQPADLALLSKLVERRWDDDVLVLAPGESLRPSHDERVISCAECPTR